MEEMSVGELKSIVLSLEAARLFKIVSKHAGLKAAIPWQRPKPEMMESAYGKAVVWRAVQKLALQNPDIGIALKREWEDQFANLLATIPADGEVTTLFRLLRPESSYVGDALVDLGRMSPEVWAQVKELLQLAHSPGVGTHPEPDDEEQRKAETKQARIHKKELERLKTEKQKAEQDANAKVRQLQNRISSLDEKLRLEQSKGRAQEEEIARLKAALAGERQRVQQLERETEQRDLQLQGALGRVEGLKQLLDGANNRTAEEFRRMQELEATIGALQARLETEAVRLPVLVAQWAYSYDWSETQYVLEKTRRELQAVLEENQPSLEAGLEAIWSTWIAAESVSMRTICGLTGVPTPGQVREHLSLMWDMESSLLVRIAVIRQLAQLAQKAEEYYIKAGGV